MSDEQPGAQELAEAEALARALEGRAPDAGGQEPPRDALEVAALLRLLQPSAALDPARSQAVLERVLDPAAAGAPDEASTAARRAPAPSARVGRVRWLWGGLGAASSLAAAALVLLMLRRTAPEQEVAGARPQSAEAPAAAPAADEAVAASAELPRAAATAPASVPLEAAEPAALERAMARADRSQQPQRTPPAQAAKKQAQAAPPLPAAPAPEALASSEPSEERGRPARAARSAPLAVDELAGYEPEPAARAEPVAPAALATGARAQLLLLQAKLVAAELAREAPAERAADAALLQQLVAAQSRYREQVLVAPRPTSRQSSRSRAPHEVQLEASFELASGALADGDTASALAYARRGLRLTAEPSPSLVSLWIVQAMAERSAQQPDAARESCRRAQAVLERLRDAAR